MPNLPKQTITIGSTRTHVLMTSLVVAGCMFPPTEATICFDPSTTLLLEAFAPTLCAWRPIPVALEACASTAQRPHRPVNHLLSPLPPILYRAPPPQPPPQQLKRSPPPLLALPPTALLLAIPYPTKPPSNRFPKDQNQTTSLPNHGPPISSAFRFTMRPISPRTLPLSDHILRRSSCIRIVYVLRYVYISL